MRIYARNLKYRLKEMLIAFSLVFLALIVCFLLFYNKIKSINYQLSSYNVASYNYIYVMNYDVGTLDTMAYPDTDVQVFMGDVRIPVSVVMATTENEYDSAGFSKPISLKHNEMAISQNVAEKYKLNIGDVVSVEYPYTTTRVDVEITQITDYNIDFANPNIDNDIGIVVIGRDDTYIDNTKCDYLCFSKTSQAAELEKYPQLLKSLINKPSLESEVFNQGIGFIIVESILMIGVIIVSHIAYFSKSYAIIKRLYLKGTRPHMFVVIPMNEQLLFGVLPVIVATVVELSFVPCVSTYTLLYYLIPVIISSADVIVSLIRNSIKIGRR